MTGKFSAKDEARCHHYARFMKNLTLAQANAVFWALFFWVLFLMCIASVQHHKSICLSEKEKTLDPKKTSSRKRHRKVRAARQYYLGISGFCFTLATAGVVLECFALFNIQFCDGEDLMQLYWGFWSILQVGSLIAIGGVMLQLWIVLADVETPSWAVALGTPVLVFAALSWTIKRVCKNIWRRWTGQEVVDSDESGEGTDEEEKIGVEEWGSRAPTISGNTRFDSSENLESRRPSRVLTA
ncbi:hypothetical protein G7Y89_g5291 [Cudoniella acicularis]|uniref:Uncharacterized protein n=1 Tax=Cudoniella acicularis TaxID=354080 RepID=A0A8H4RQ02_9HELO|nr:hypothetical protein G7Y89_g5291 [Cudoniella acicularis]